MNQLGEGINCHVFVRCKTSGLTVLHHLQTRWDLFNYRQPGLNRTKLMTSSSSVHIFSRTLRILRETCVARFHNESDSISLNKEEHVNRSRGLHASWTDSRCSRQLRLHSHTRSPYSAALQLSFFHWPQTQMYNSPACLRVRRSEKRSMKL